MLIWRKKRKLADAMLKMLTGTPEYEREKHRRQEAKWKREKKIDKTKNFFNFCGVGFLMLLAIVVLFSAIICPIYFYTYSEVTFTPQNISDTQYAYILNGSPSMHIKYFGETRSLNDSQITFHIYVSHCWNHTEKAEIWAAQGNIIYLGMNASE